MARTNRGVNPAPGKDDSSELWNYFVHIGDNGEQDIIPEVSFIGNVGLHGPDTEAAAQYLLNGHKDEQGKAYLTDRDENQVRRDF